MAVSLKGNGINIVMNMFFAATLNAAFGIALHVQSSLNGFVQNFTNAAIPQLIQSYAAGETAYMEKLLLFSSKVAFFLLLLAAFPVIFDADFLLALWLKQVPPFTSIFVRLMLIDALINTPIYALGALAQATGTIALYQVVVSGIILLNVPLTYLVFKFGGLPQTAIAVAILLSLLALLGRLLILKKLIPGFPLRDFLCSFLFRAVLAAGFAALPPLICLWFMSPGWIRFAVSSTTCVGTTVGMILLIGFNRQERGDVCRIVREAVYKRLMWN